jgi:hypothetical protein
MAASASRKASPSRPAAKSAGDWVPVGKAAARPKARTVAANGHTVDPEQVIPMDDGDLSEF